MAEESQIVEELVRAAAAGSEAARGELLRRHWVLIEAMVSARRRRMARDLKVREQTADLAQELALRLLRDLPRHEWRGRGAFLAWVRRLSDNAVIDAQRYHQAQRRRAGAETDVSDEHLTAVHARSPESQIDAERRTVALYKTLAYLKPDYRAAVLMHHAGFTHAEIGEHLDCTAEAARKLVARAHARLAGRAL